MPHIPDRAAFFLQGSKNDYVPHNYIALVGDSNAQGMGDWMLENGLDRSKPYHSADILHQVLHTDVVSLGRAASGSAEALVLRVTEVFGECAKIPRRILQLVEEPQEVRERFFTALARGGRCLKWVIRVIPAIAACPVRPKSGHSATGKRL